MKYVAYYRVSTDKQGDSGLGLEAQRSDIRRFIHPNNIDIELTEIESGRKQIRPVLNEAVTLCKKHGATLLIAKLDRLARNVSFVSTLMNSGVKFIAVDMPQATELTIHIYAAMAEDEAKRISSRTKAALKVKKEQGYKLGKPENLTQEARLKGAKIMRTKAIENTNNQRARAFLGLLNGTLQVKAQQLNENGFRTAKNCLFTPMQVRRLLVPK
jgi:DNA invertase Pin-like site-specific DNA recombinase